MIARYSVTPCYTLCSSEGVTPESACCVAFSLTCYTCYTRLRAYRGIRGTPRGSARGSAHIRPPARENRCNGCNTVTIGVFDSEGGVTALAPRAVDPSGGIPGPTVAMDDATPALTPPSARKVPSRRRGEASALRTEGGRLVVRLELGRDQAGDVVAGLLDRRGGYARVECGGVVLELVVKEVR